MSSKEGWETPKFQSHFSVGVLLLPSPCCGIMSGMTICNALHLKTHQQNNHEMLNTCIRAVSVHWVCLFEYEFEFVVIVSSPLQRMLVFHSFSFRSFLSRQVFLPYTTPTFKAVPVRLPGAPRWQYS